jgi:hypothetical protein
MTGPILARRKNRKLGRQFPSFLAGFPIRDSQEPCAVGGIDYLCHVSLLDPDRLAALYGKKPAPAQAAQEDACGKRKKCCKKFKGDLRCEDCPLR